MIDGLSIVVPAYNEEATIAATVTDALAAGAGVARALEVVVCDDGSRDRTRAIVEDLAAADPRVRVVARRRNRGIEASIRTLYAVARHEWVFLNSADRQWPMTALVPMAKAVEQGADLVIGVRRNKRDIYSPYRQVLSWTYEAVVRRLGAPEDYPLSNRFDEVDTLMVLDNVLIPWEDVFFHRFTEGARFIRGTLHRYSAFPYVLRILYTADMMIGAAMWNCKQTGLDKMQSVKEKLADMVAYREGIRAHLAASIALAEKSPGAPMRWRLRATRLLGWMSVAMLRQF